MRGVGAFGDVAQAELVADERAPGLVAEEVDVRARDESDEGGPARRGLADPGGPCACGGDGGLRLRLLAEDSPERFRDALE